VGKYGFGLWAFDPLGDRFNPDGYKPVLDLMEKIKMAGLVEIAEGVELHYPSDFTEDRVDQVRRALKDAGLAVPTLCVNLFTDPRWQRGSLTSRDPRLRAEALETVKRAMDISERMGWGACTLWMGQDGHDYLFNDYGGAWDRVVQGVREAAEYRRRVRLYLEYKQKEPRTHMQVANVGKALYLVGEVGAENLGVVVDVGHAFMADENVAESVAMLGRRGVPFTMHFNDAYGYWDDDMIAGSINLWRYAELFYQLRKMGYEGWYDLDIFPYREDPVRAVEQSLEFVDYMVRRVGENYEEIDRLVQEGDVHKTIDGVRRIFLKGYK